MNINKFKKYVDVDGDGYISPYDLETFINRYSSLHHAKSEVSHSVKSYGTSIKSHVLYPKVPLTEF